MIEEKVRTVLSKILEIQTVDIDDIFSSKTCEKWDSMKHMEIILELENSFDIEFSENEIIELREFQKIIKILKDKNVS